LNLKETNKKKIINDPVYGFINISSDRIYDLIEHPYFQRLRRIRQLGMTNFVYPAANHSRFQHALGATHLMDMAIDVIRSKGHNITDEEAEAAQISILLHDIGHGPFSHALEYHLLEGINHEDLSLMIMKAMNKEMDGQLSMAIDIFTNSYHKKPLHQLVSSQLDMDRLDYLNRDSFFTGVNEGIIGSDRIIKMLNIHNDELVVEAKGIYSIEKFLIARRLMYWQVYLHKTVISAENLLNKILQRARYLALNQIDLYTTPALGYFLNNQINRERLENEDPELLENFVNLDDSDIIVCTKVWEKHADKILSQLCKNLNNRKLYKITLQNQAFDSGIVHTLRQKASAMMDISYDDTEYFVFTGSISNNAYKPDEEKINILYNNGVLADITDASDIINVSVLSRIVKKHFICYPKLLVG